MRIGILGGGQLGRMLGLAGLPLGMRFHFLEPAPDPPAGDVGELIPGEYHDLRALDLLVEEVDLVTYEFENVPATATEHLRAAGMPVLPPPVALAVAQDRLREKELFESVGIPTPRYRPVDSESGLREALVELGLPCILKTRRMGYDGKGQVVLRDPGDVPGAWRELGPRGPLLLEGFVAFRRELSVVAVRGRDGTVAAYPLAENLHRGGILVRSTAPAPGVTPELAEGAERYARLLMEKLGYVGVMALELFQEGETLLANEIAPRVHNSGHWTQDGARVSQFENHLRAVAGLPLGSTEAVGHSVMLNLLGALPPLSPILREPLAHLHLYGKKERPGRKLGHVNVSGEDRGEVEATVSRILPHVGG